MVVLLINFTGGGIICVVNRGNQKLRLLDYDNMDLFDDREAVLKIIKNLKNLTDYCQCSFTWDTDENRLLEYKDSPIDKGREIFETLLKNRIKI